MYTCREIVPDREWEVAKWTDRKEPTLYRVTKTKRSWHCDFCFRRANFCKHAEIVTNFIKSRKLGEGKSYYYDNDTKKFKKTEFML